MTGTFYKFAKKLNSTARPSGGASVVIELKEQTSIINPILLLNQLSFPDYNYCYLPDFNRYYYINDITWVNGIWELSCSVDALATYKDIIGATPQFVTRSAIEQDENIIDTNYPVKTNYTDYIDPISIGFTWQTLSSGWYIVGLIGKFSYMDPQAGTTTYIVLKDAAMKNLMQQLFANNLNWYLQPGESDIGISQTLGKMIFDPFQYIRSVRWVPIEPPTKEGTLSQIEIGWWTFSPPEGIKYLADYPIIEDTASAVPIRKHPKASTRGRFLNSSRFSQYRLFIPTVGVMELDANLLLEFDYLSFGLQLDPIEGKTRIDIWAYENVVDRPLKFIRREFGEFGMDIDLSQASIKLSEAVKVASSIGAAATGAASGNPSLVASGIADFADLLRPPIDSIGSNSGFISMAENQSAFLWSIFYDISDEYRRDIGRPLCKTRTPAELTGYMICDHSDISIPGTEQEANTIKEYLEGGFFYE